jgi:hypothetical protein
MTFRAIITIRAIKNLKQANKAFATIKTKKGSLEISISYLSVHQPYDCKRLCLNYS